MEDMDMLEAVYERKSRMIPVGPQPSVGGGDFQQPMMQWKEEEESAMGMDELLAHAGYNVRASDLTHVAQRIEELDSLLGAAAPADILAQDTVHYNPSDLVSWIEGMLDELVPQQPTATSSSDMESVVTTITHQQQQHLDFGGIPPPPPHQQQGYGAAFNPNVLYADQMDLSKNEVGVVASHSQIAASTTPRPASGSSSSTSPHGIPPHAAGGMTSAAAMPTIQESDELSGVRLVHLLLACANAVQRGDLAAAGDMVAQLRILVAHPSSSSSAMARVATQFVEALSRRIQNSCYNGGGDRQYHHHQSQQQQQRQQQFKEESSDPGNTNNGAMDEILHFHFYETCPYLKFAHFTANQAILEALEGHKSVHVVDLDLQYGLQWPALIQALALRPGGPPTLRLTGIGPPQPHRHDLLHEIGLKLAQLADSVNVDFAFHGVVAARLNDVQPWMLTVRRGEAVAVNSVFQMHKALVEEPSDGGNPAAGGNGGGGRRSSPIDEVLRLVRNLKPKIVTLVEQDADHNSPVFMERFMAALHYYSTMFDSLEACNLAPGSVEQMVAETYLGQEIGNIVACEGAARTERHETLTQWRIRMARSGFQPLYLGSNAFKQANMLLTLFSGDGYRVEEKDGCLTLGWHSRPLVAASAWECC
ncbi:GRAS-family protein [Selaginella moellendorffii]|uniref:GRAS-family protein n=1 Tax=Selaginella moellendorffii TaxID=88036 RepID=A9LY09_SELML|nr:DELLA protein RGL3 [Selaginella moellendorffii]ABX10758.1 putative DELLA protein [Selaginella moellendorffii]EFJ37787.1 GRAS-family protein [Selaginella moellendorffii]|eukprot:XP_002960248.1 DELLA protein RGL3 [Selaginella moellendorffii]